MKNKSTPRNLLVGTIFFRFQFSFSGILKGSGPELLGWVGFHFSREKLSALEEELDCFAHVQQLKEEALEPSNGARYDMI